MEQNPHTPQDSIELTKALPSSIPLSIPLTKALGDATKAIILGQIIMWIRDHIFDEEHLSEPIHFREGCWWADCSYEDWRRHGYDFLTSRTIQRHTLALEKTGILISRMFDKHKGDRTKWYTVDLDKLSALIAPYTSNGGEVRS